MNKYFRWGMRLIGPLLLIYILSRTDLAGIAKIVREINPWPLMLSLALMPPFVAVKTWRWNMLMRELKLTPPSLGYGMALYCIGLFYGGATPGQSGDFLKAWYLRDRGLPLPPTLFSILLDRLFDFMIMAPLALLSLAAFPTLVPQSVQTLAVVAAMVFLCATPLLMARGVRNWGMNFVLPLLPATLQAKLEQWRGQFDTLSLRPWLMIRLFAASIGSAAATMLRIWLLFLALQLQVPILAIIGSTALLALLQTLPISFSGVGVRDALLVAVLAAYGYTQEQAIALSALFLLLNIEHILVGFLVSLRYPLGQKPTAELKV